MMTKHPTTKEPRSAEAEPQERSAGCGSIGKAIDYILPVDLEALIPSLGLAYLLAYIIASVFTAWAGLGVWVLFYAWMVDGDVRLRRRRQTYAVCRAHAIFGAGKHARIGLAGLRISVLQIDPLAGKWSAQEPDSVTCADPELFGGSYADPTNCAQNTGVIGK